ncbi:MAG TPA: hypothetical protein VMS65_04935 [Polyangiaceae bacterium]|nr:hypothetical protein [Polyangiaceae bacterium]
MAKTFDSAISELYQAPFERFVSERKRLAKELDAAGDASGARSLAKVTRPPISVWTVNQLWWKERKAFGDLFETAERLRDADAEADEVAAHRDAISALRARAAKVLKEAGKSATESTLRRVTSTLTALAAVGSFDPDSPGALKGDRDPPGFDVPGLTGIRSTGAQASTREKKTGDPAASKSAQAETKRREKAAEIADRRREEREQAQRQAERERLERKLRLAEGVLDERREELTRLKEKISDAEKGVVEAREVVRELRKQLPKS